MLKLGQVFTKYGNYGTPHTRFVQLSQDEKKLTWSSIGGCRFFRAVKSIDVNNIKDVYIGASTSKIFEKYHIPYDYDHNCFSIASGERSLDLRGDDENICKKWYHGIKFLIKRTRSIKELKMNKNSLKDFMYKNEILSDVWKTEILPNWHIYRKFVIVQARGTLYDEVCLGNKNTKEKIHRTILYKVKSTTNSAKILDKSEFLYVWTLGIPSWLRKKMWPLIIGNESGIGENLFNFHFKKVEELNFEEMNKIVFEQGVKNKSEEDNNDYKNFNYNRENKDINHIAKVILSDDLILNEILNDLIKISTKFSIQIKEQNIFGSLPVNSFTQCLQYLILVSLITL